MALGEKIKRPIYFDYAATTPVDPRVAELMCQYLTMNGCFANPSSNTHLYGLQAHKAVEQARQQVANLVSVDPEEIIFTSGATESDNLAIIGAAQSHQNKGRHIITSKIEHKAVLDTCKHLESLGFEVTYLSPEKDGSINLEKFKSAIRPDTILVSIMHVNNEIGIINDIRLIGEICREHKIIFHVDAAQSLGKIPINLKILPVDLMSFSAHKIYGPKGVGALFVRNKPKVRIQAQIYGGGHERGLRSGTLALHQIVGMGKAFELAQAEMDSEFERLSYYKTILWECIRQLQGIFLNGTFELSLPGILNFSVAGVEGTALLWAVNQIAVSTGSACTSASIAPSYVLSALGVPDNLAHSTLRISFGRFTSLDEINFAAKHIKEGINFLRSVAPNPFEKK